MSTVTNFNEQAEVFQTEGRTGGHKEANGCFSNVNALKLNILKFLSLNTNRFLLRIAVQATSNMMQTRPMTGQVVYH